MAGCFEFKNDVFFILIKIYLAHQVDKFSQEDTQINKFKIYYI